VLQFKDQTITFIKTFEIINVRCYTDNRFVWIISFYFQYILNVSKLLTMIVEIIDARQTIRLQLMNLYLILV